MSQEELDITQNVKYDIKIIKDRTLKPVFSCYYMDGDTEVDYNFSSYTGATLNVKKQSRSSNTILDFNTDDNSIVLSTGNTFQLIKTSGELANIQTGTFKYDMYLKSATYPKRAFMSGEFIIEDRITI